MKSTLLVLALCLGLVASLSIPMKVHSESEYREAFVSWMDKHDRKYTSDEFFYRYDIFKNNMDFVTRWNAGNSTTVLGLNNMADLANTEYQAIFLGTRINAADKLRASVSTIVDAPLADTVDWRTKGAVTPIKDQGQCGSCWAFSAIATTESAHFFATGQLVSLSEQNLVDCSSAYGNEGCNGGLMDSAFQYIINNKGVDTEASYPYRAVTGTCQFKAANVGATLAAFTDVQSGNEAELLKAIGKGPVSVAIDASRMSFQLYHSGVYNEPKCSSTLLDHGVTAVGYGTDDASGKDYYIVKNSWGTSWGQEGYIWMSRNNKNNCGIATSASYPNA